MFSERSQAWISAGPYFRIKVMRIPVPVPTSRTLSPDRRPLAFTVVFSRSGTPLGRGASKRSTLSLKYSFCSLFISSICSGVRRSVMASSNGLVQYLPGFRMSSIALPAKDDKKSEYHTCELSRQKHPTLALAQSLFSAERQVRRKVLLWTNLDLNIRFHKIEAC